MTHLIALEPPIPVAEALIVAQEELEAPLRHLGFDARFVGPEHLRLVLATLPDDPAPDLTRVRDGLRTIAATTGELRLTLGGVTAVPDERRPRLLAAAAAETDGIAALHRRVAALLDACGLGPGTAAWEPLVPLVRLATPATAHELDSLLARYRETVFGGGRVRELVLLRGDRRVRGGRPEVLERIELGTGR